MLACTHAALLHAGHMTHVLEHASHFAEMLYGPPCTPGSSICFLPVYCISSLHEVISQFIGSQHLVGAPSAFLTLQLLENHTSRPRLTMLLIIVFAPAGGICRAQGGGQPNNSEPCWIWTGHTSASQPRGAVTYGVNAGRQRGWRFAVQATLALDA